MQFQALKGNGFYGFLIPMIVCFQGVEVIVRQTRGLARYDYLIYALLTGLVVSALMLFIISRIEQDKEKRSLLFFLTSIAVFYYFSIGKVYDKILLFLFVFLESNFKVPPFVFCVVFIVGIAIVFAFIKLSGINFGLLNKYLFFTTIFFSVTQIFVFVSRLETKFKGDFVNLPVLNSSRADPKRFPDIYYIIIDAYTSSKSLKCYANEENELDLFLKEKGFYLATDSKSNYPVTYPSLASALNISYLNIGSNSVTGYRGQEILKKHIRESLIFNFFKQKGYSLEFLSHIFGNGKSTELLEKPMVLYYTSVYKRSLFYPLVQNVIEKRVIDGYSKKDSLLIKNPLSYSYYSYNKSVYDGLLENAKDSMARNSKLVYAHFMNTHAPFVSDINGNYKDIYFYPPTVSDYVVQIRDLNKKLKYFIELLLKNKENNRSKIIIIQADHGSHLFGKKEMHDIQNSYYFSDKDYRSLYVSISPINSFRVVLNKYFGENLPFLPDKELELSY